jgi:hypothetical protein
MRKLLICGLASAALLAACGDSVPPANQGITAIQSRAQASGAATVAGYRSNYTVGANADGSIAVTRVLDQDVTTFPAATRTIQFADATVSFDSAGVPGQAYRLYQAAFNRKPDEAGLGFWISVLAGGTSLADAAGYFQASAEFQSTYGKVDDAQFVQLVYSNVLHRPAEPAGFDFWLGQMKNGMARQAVLAFFSESDENKGNAAAAIRNGINYIPASASGVSAAAIQAFAPPAAPSPPKVAYPALTADTVIAGYSRAPVENGYHSGQIALRAGSTTLLKWTNASGVTMTLTPDFANGLLKTDSSNPYQNNLNGKDFTLVYQDGKVVGFKFVGEFYQRDGAAIKAPLVGQPAAQSIGLHGFLYHDLESAPPDYNYGHSHYVAMWPIMDEPVHGYQSGIGFFVNADNAGYTQPLLPPDNAMRMNNPDGGPNWGAYFQTIEGGPGYWGSDQYRARDPKFRIVGTPDGYAHGMGSPGWGFNTTPTAREQMSIAQLSNRLLAPPDGVTFRKGTSGEFLGYGWMALPLTDERQSTVPVGNQNWTLFFNTANFAGPVAFWVPDAWARLSKTWAPAAGRGLDARPGKVGNAVLEISTVPAFQSYDAGGASYWRSPRILFPVDAKGVTYLTTDRIDYSAAALFTPLKTWFAGGTAISGAFDSAGAFRPKLPAALQDLHFGDQGLPIAGLDKFVSPVVVATPGGGTAWGLKWTGAGTPGVFPEYFRASATAMTALAADEVPASTNLAAASFTPHSAARGSYVALTGASDSWFSPAPAAGPFQATLSDGSVVTYYWFRFIDQPSLQGFGWSAQEKARLQARVELLHRNWSGTREFMAPPTAGALATIDAGLLVNPPAGLEYGYVPVVTKQGTVQ